MTHAIELSAATSGYAGVPVLRGVDLHVDPGEVVALLGGNGAGKTTALLTLAGVLKSIHGVVRALGEPVKAGRPYRQARNGVVLVPDDRSVFANLTCRENLKLARVSRNLRSETEDLVLQYFPALRPKLTVPAGQLSGGEQQMLAVGRALASRPRVLMIDELSLGLAPLVVQEMLPTIRTIAAELDTAILLVEQHVDLVLEHSDRAYVLNHGRIALSGDSADLLADKTTLRASYLVEEPVR
ncbi:ABC transporter ATP-binding protein [Gordonia hydrophobica]|uniref:ABC transporter ATP-binding protein n=1 Tax=Gordonia hydrophobica TaxID=40516 RepID=A0ABZ2TWA5_9ACTN|nr:ABC transporter ATP-binding protein [Gordonia hydrophobica]MBM7365806.1 branched-chain amino acid transport system ATP-binding protein [Gordonia hydrophobica]